MKPKEISVEWGFLRGEGSDAEVDVWVKCLVRAGSPATRLDPAEPPEIEVLESRIDDGSMTPTDLTDEELDMVTSSEEVLQLADEAYHDRYC